MTHTQRHHPSPLMREIFANPPNHFAHPFNDYGDWTSLTTWTWKQHILDSMSKEELEDLLEQLKYFNES